MKKAYFSNIESTLRGAIIDSMLGIGDRKNSITIFDDDGKCAIVNMGVEDNGRYTVYVLHDKQKKYLLKRTLPEGDEFEYSLSDDINRAIMATKVLCKVLLMWGFEI